MTAESARLTAARERVVAATAALDEISAEAGRVRDARRDRWRRLGQVASGTTTAVALGVVTVVLVVVAVVTTVIAAGADDDRARLDEVLVAARDAVTVTLTADPASPAAYVDAVRAVAGGDFLRRVESASPAIEAAVAAQGLRSTGEVVSAGVVGGDTGDGSVTVLVVAQATNPQLLGGAAGDDRLVLDIEMVHAGGRWTLDRADLR